jgi:hypothetical protein
MVMEDTKLVVSIPGQQLSWAVNHTESVLCATGSDD